MSEADMRAIMAASILPIHRARPDRAVPATWRPPIAAPPDPILAEIARFLAETGITASDFGIAAIGDPNLVGDLRRGREPRRRTLARIRHFIEHGEG